MTRTKSAIFIAVFAVASMLDGLSDDAPARQPATTTVEKNSTVSKAVNSTVFTGRWEISKPVRLALGYSKNSDQFKNLDIEIVERFPDKKPTDKDTFDEAEWIRSGALKAGHKIVAMGHLSFLEDMPGKRVFALTSSEGKLSLWFGAAWVGLLEVPVSFIPGSSKDRDLLFLQWPNSPPDTWVFQRQRK